MLVPVWYRIVYFVTGWLPSHVGIRGIDQAGSAAKAALTNNIYPFKLPYTDNKGLINESLNLSM